MFMGSGRHNLIKIYGKKAIFLKRLNKFVAEIEINGQKKLGYVNNTGKLNLLAPNSFIFCFPHKGKTDYRVFAVKVDDGWAIIDTQLQMRAFEHAMLEGYIPWARCHSFKRNVRVGESLIDYQLDTGPLVEVKSAVMIKNHTALYPDCPSKRGAKHIKELIDYVKSGGKAMIVFIAAIPNANKFKPSKIDPKIYKLLKEAKKKGVIIKAIGMDYKKPYITLYSNDLKVEI